MLHDSRQPLGETGLAKHGFPPCGCGSLHTPQYAARREVRLSHFQKTSPCKSTQPPVHPPLRGPETLDEAIADLCNRLMRIAWTTPWQPQYAAEVGRELMFSLQQSF